MKVGNYIYLKPLRKWMEVEKITQKQLGVICGVSQAAAHRWCDGKTKSMAKEYYDIIEHYLEPYMNDLTKSMVESNLPGMVRWRSDVFIMLDDAMEKHDWSLKWVVQELDISREKLFSWLDCKQEYIMIPIADMPIMGEISRLLREGPKK